MGARSAPIGGVQNVRDTTWIAWRLRGSSFCGEGFRSVRKHPLCITTVPNNLLCFIYNVLMSIGLINSNHEEWSRYNPCFG